MFPEPELCKGSGTRCKRKEGKARDAKSLFVCRSLVGKGSMQMHFLPRVKFSRKIFN